MDKILNEYTALDNVRFYGRVARLKDCEATYFNWSGSGFCFKFKGTKAECYLWGSVKGEDVPGKENRGYIGVYVDDIPVQTARFALDKAQGWYTLAENLTDTEHTVYVVKETELYYGKAAVSKIRTDGELLPPPESKKLKIEVIGDSISCGYGNICSNRSSEFVTAEENFSLTYAAIAARMLDAELSVIAASGNGFFHDYGCNSHNLIPELYLYTDKILYEHWGEVPVKWALKTTGAIL